MGIGQWTIEVDGEHLPCDRRGIAAYAQSLACGPKIKHVSIWHDKELVLTVLRD